MTLRFKDLTFFYAALWFFLNPRFIFLFFFSSRWLLKKMHVEVLFIYLADPAPNRWNKNKLLLEGWGVGGRWRGGGGICFMMWFVKVTDWISVGVNEPNRGEEKKSGGLWSPTGRSPVKKIMSKSIRLVVKLRRSRARTAGGKPCLTVSPAALTEM